MTPSEKEIAENIESILDVALKVLELKIDDQFRQVLGRLDSIQELLDIFARELAHELSDERASRKSKPPIDACRDQPGNSSQV